jgi:hypothetical protein
MIFDRSDGNRSRALRLAQIKKGPGVFVYDGSSVDDASEPTILMHDGRSEPVFDASGRPSLDAAGRQIFHRRGTPVRDERGAPVMGGVPKVTGIEVKERKIWGHTFPTGVEVAVKDNALALKLRGMGCFKEVEPKAQHAAAERQAPTGDLNMMTRQDLMRVAKERGLEYGRDTTRDEMLALLTEGGE